MNCGFEYRAKHAGTRTRGVRIIETPLGQDVTFDGNLSGALISWGQLIYIVELLSPAVPRGVYAEPAKNRGKHKIHLVRAFVPQQRLESVLARIYSRSLA
jgi:hypothetical protein